MTGETLRGSCVALEGAGVLLRGDSGSGKSDLALRLIDSGAMLVSDDYVYVTRTESGIQAAPPDAIRGLIELRGIGLVRMPYCENVTLALVLDLQPSFRVPRLPEQRHADIMGISLPLFVLAGLEPSAPAKVRQLLRALKNNGFQAELPSR